MNNLLHAIQQDNACVQSAEQIHVLNKHTLQASYAPSDQWPYLRMELVKVASACFLLWCQNTSSCKELLMCSMAAILHQQSACTSSTMPVEAEEPGYMPRHNTMNCTKRWYYKKSTPSIWSRMINWLSVGMLGTNLQYLQLSGLQYAIQDT